MGFKEIEELEGKQEYGIYSLTRAHEFHKIP
jgi:hypothetical protein